MRLHRSDRWHPWTRDPWWKIVQQIRRHNRLKAFTLFRLRRFPRHPRWQTLCVRARLRRFWPKLPLPQHPPLKKTCEHKQPFQQQWRNRQR